MLGIEDLKACPTQSKAFLSVLGVIGPFDTRLMTFDLCNVEPHLPPSVVFQIPDTTKNIVINHCIIDEGASTRVMSVSVWNKLCSPKLVPSMITLRPYDARPFHKKGFWKNGPIETTCKTVLIDIEVVDDANLEYNNLLGRSYICVMKICES